MMFYSCLAGRNHRQPDMDIQQEGRPTLFTKETMNHVQGTKTMSEKKQYGFAEAKQIGDALSIRWDKFDVEQFTLGLNVELEHGRRDPRTDVTHDEPMVTGKIALAHLNEIPDYYTRMAVMENEAERLKSRSQKKMSVRDTPAGKKHVLSAIPQIGSRRGEVDELRWLREKGLKHTEDVIDGLENNPKAFSGLFAAADPGKQLVKVS